MRSKEEIYKEVEKWFGGKSGDQGALRLNHDRAFMALCILELAHAVEQLPATLRAVLDAEDASRE